MLRLVALLFMMTGIQLSYGSSQDSLLLQLEKFLSKRDSFILKKTSDLTQLKKEIGEVDVNNHPLEFDACLRLFNQYKSFKYDSAYKYLENAQRAAYKLHDPTRISISKIKFGFLLISSGLFKEALDTLNAIDVKTLPDSIKFEFYSTIGRTYFDLADYDNDLHFAGKSRMKGILYLDTALRYTVKNSSAYWSCESLRRMKLPGMTGAMQAFEYWIGNYKLTDHEFAIAASSLGYLYSLNNKREEAIEWLIKAAIADIKTSTKETVALRNLSNLLFQQGETKMAYRFIKMSLDDATFYNARHRKIEIAAILPIIEGERLATVEAQKKKLVGSVLIVSILSILIIISLLIIYKQLRKLKKVRKILQDTNHNLQFMNTNLSESNKIKEEYIGYFFNINSEYIDKIDAFQKSIHRKIVARQYDDLDTIVKNSDLKKERENLYLNFDKIFLKLFPHFVEEFNALFSPEDRIVLRKDELLNPDLRIFALMRLGIKDNDKIAKFLNYSVTTIYTYKTKIRSKSLFREQFDEKIMEIRTN